MLLWESFTDIHLLTLLTLLQLLKQTIRQYLQRTKSIFRTGDFNVILLNYNEHNQTGEFFTLLPRTHLFL